VTAHSNASITLCLRTTVTRERERESQCRRHRRRRNHRAIRLELGLAQRAHLARRKVRVDAVTVEHVLSETTHATHDVAFGVLGEADRAALLQRQRSVVGTQRLDAGCRIELLLRQTDLDNLCWFVASSG